MAGTDGGEASSNWLSRFAALILAVVAGLWFYEYAKDLPEFKQELKMEEKGVYQGPADEPLSPDELNNLADRSRGQSF